MFDLKLFTNKDGTFILEAYTMNNHFIVNKSLSPSETEPYIEAGVPVYKYAEHQTKCPLCKKPL